MTLHELAKIPENATDKQNPDHAFAGRNYLHHYERHFESLRDRPVKLLEIGVFGGWSLRLWRDYFPLGDIHGLDIDPQCEGQNDDRITVHIGSQDDCDTLDKLSQTEWDIIIDDGSHYVPHILHSFEHLWSHVRRGGFYVWEDMRCSLDGVSSGWPGMKLNPDLDEMHKLQKREPINKSLIRSIEQMDRCTGDLAALHLYPMIYFFEKA